MPSQGQGLHHKPCVWYPAGWGGTPGVEPQHPIYITQPQSTPGALRHTCHLGQDLFPRGGSSVHPPTTLGPEKGSQGGPRSPFLALGAGVQVSRERTHRAPRRGHRAAVGQQQERLLLQAAKQGRDGPAVWRGPGAGIRTRDPGPSLQLCGRESGRMSSRPPRGGARCRDSATRGSSPCSTLHAECLPSGGLPSGRAVPGSWPPRATANL